MAKIDARERVLRSVSEAAFQQSVLELAAACRWLLCHFRPGTNRRGSWSTPINGAPGFPDATLVRGRRLLFVEFKDRLGKLTPDQERWRTALQSVCAYSEFVEYHVWRPGDLDKAARVLSREGER